MHAAHNKVLIFVSAFHCRISEIGRGLGKEISLSRKGMRGRAVPKPGRERKNRCIATKSRRCHRINRSLQNHSVSGWHHSCPYLFNFSERPKSLSYAEFVSVSASEVTSSLVLETVVRNASTSDTKTFAKTPKVELTARRFAHAWVCQSPESLSSPGHPCP
jgi:hypothetical protein